MALISFTSFPSLNRLFEWLINHDWLLFKRIIDVLIIQFDFNPSHPVRVATPLYVWVRVCYLRVCFNFIHPILFFLTVISLFFHILLVSIDLFCRPLLLFFFSLFIYRLSGFCFTLHFLLFIFFQNFSSLRVVWLVTYFKS